MKWSSPKQRATSSISCRSTSNTKKRGKPSILIRFISFHQCHDSSLSSFEEEGEYEEEASYQQEGSVAYAESIPPSEY